MVIPALALGWMVLISWAHYILNMDSGDIRTVKMGYMPVVANISCPLMDAAAKNNPNLRMEAVKFSSFADMGEALRNGHIQAAFIIAPLSIVLKQQGEDIKVVFIGSRHESTLVGRTDLPYTDFRDLAGKTIAVPMRYSGHHLALLRLADEHGVKNQVHIVEMNPPDMASALATGALDAYFVGEPFAAKTVMAGKAKVLQYVEASWPDFICNLMIMKAEFIRSHPKIAAKVVETAVRAALWAEKHPLEAAKIAAAYWNQPLSLVEYVFSTPKGRFRFDRYLPKMEEMQYMADLMALYGLAGGAGIEGIVDDTLVKQADTGGIEGFDTILAN